MNEQTFIPGTEPQLATGPWTGEVDAAERGRYLVVRSDGYGEMDVFLCDGEGYWLDAFQTEPVAPPALIARIHPPEVVQ